MGRVLCHWLKLLGLMFASRPAEKEPLPFGSALGQVWPVCLSQVTVTVLLCV